MKHSNTPNKISQEEIIETTIEEEKQLIRFYENLSNIGKNQFKKFSETIDGQIYLITLAEEFAKAYPEKWTEIGGKENEQKTI